MIRALTPLAAVRTTASTGVPSGNCPKASRRAVAASADPPIAAAPTSPTIIILQFIKQPSSKHSHGPMLLVRPHQPVTKGQSERLRFNLEFIPDLGHEAVGERQGCGSKEMDMDVAGAPELRI